MAGKNSKKKLKSGREINYDKGEKGVRGTPEDARRKDSPYYLADRVKKKRRFETGDKLLEAALEYFEAVKKNPMKETKVFGSGFKHDMDLEIPYTISGLCVFIGISKDTFYEYRKLNQKENATDIELELCATAHKIADIIYTQKIEGASAGKFNHAIVALELGLAAKVKTEKIVHDSSKMSAEEIKKYNQSLEDEY